MGSRGRDSGVGNRQMTLKNAAEQNRIAEIISNSAKKRKKLLEDDHGGAGGVGARVGKRLPKLLKKCACCGEYTIPANSEYEICPICGWVDDKYQNANPNSLSGKNPLSLNDARDRFKRISQTY